MKLLFIKLKHLGDTLLLTPTLTATRAKYPGAQIWVIVRQGCQSILAGCPAIDRVLTSAAPESSNRSPLNWLADLRLIHLLRRERFDYAFELSDGDRGRFLAWLSGAESRCANVARKPLSWWWRSKFNCQSKFPWVNRHRAEKDFFSVNDFLPLGSDVPPLTFQREFTETWPPGNPLNDFVIMHPGTRWQRKRWPQSNWIDLGRALLGRVS